MYNYFTPSAQNCRRQIHLLESYSFFKARDNSCLEIFLSGNSDRRICDDHWPWIGLRTAIVTSVISLSARLSTDHNSIIEVYQTAFRGRREDASCHNRVSRWDILLFRVLRKLCLQLSLRKRGSEEGIKRCQQGRTKYIVRSERGVWIRLMQNEQWKNKEFRLDRGFITYAWILAQYRLQGTNSCIQCHLKVSGLSCSRNHPSFKFANKKSICIRTCWNHWDLWIVTWTCSQDPIKILSGRWYLFTLFLTRVVMGNRPWNWNSTGCWW